MGIVEGQISIRLGKDDLIARGEDCFYFREGNLVFRSIGQTTLDDYERVPGDLGCCLVVNYVGKVSDMRNLKWEKYVSPRDLFSS